MSNYSFSDSDIEKIRLLNKKLLKEEERIIPFYKQLKKNLNQLTQDELIGDYNLDMNLQLFSSDENCKQKVFGRRGRSLF